jgi:hypothetical protein
MMITKSIQIVNISVDELADKLLTKIEVYLNDYAEKKGYLDQYGIGNRRYYKKEEIKSHLIKRNF